MDAFEKWWQSEFGDEYGFNRPQHRRTWDAAIKAAVAVAEDTDTVDARNSYYAQLGDATQTKSDIIANIKKLAD